MGMEQDFQLRSAFLGMVPYAEALARMQALREDRLKDHIPDTILFLEHPAVITMGRRAAQDDLKVGIDQLRDRGIEFVKTDRGGRLTYHGPGQLVGYFIINLRQRGISIQKLVWFVEEGMKQYLHDLGIIADRDCINPGLWVGAQKIASLGFHVHRDVTTHGIALNLYNDLTPFSYMIPCGVSGREITSVLKETGKQVSLERSGLDLIEIYKKLLPKPNRTPLT